MKGHLIFLHLNYSKLIHAVSIEADRFKEDCCWNSISQFTYAGAMQLDLDQHHLPPHRQVFPLQDIQRGRFKGMNTSRIGTKAMN